MNLDMMKPKDKTQDLFLPITENSETLIEFIYAHTRTRKTLDFRLIQPKETFSIKPSFTVDSKWMSALTSPKYTFLWIIKKQKILNSNFLRLRFLSVHLWN